MHLQKSMRTDAISRGYAYELSTTVSMGGTLALARGQRPHRRSFRTPQRVITKRVWKHALHCLCYLGVGPHVVLHCSNSVCWCVDGGPNMSMPTQATIPLSVMSRIWSMYWHHVGALAWMLEMLFDEILLVSMCHYKSALLFFDFIIHILYIVRLHDAHSDFGCSLGSFVHTNLNWLIETRQSS